MFPAIVKVFRYFFGVNILFAKSPPISDRSGDLLRKIFGECFGFSWQSEKWITAKTRDFCRQYPHTLLPAIETTDVKVEVSFLYFNYLVSVTAGGPRSPRGHM